MEIFKDPQKFIDAFFDKRPTVVGFGNYVWNLELSTDLAKEIKFIDVRDERTGAHMADGYARASGKAGIVIAGQNGPGATNLVTGIAQANAAFSPVISLAGDTASEHKGKNGFQEIDQQALFE